MKNIGTAFLLFLAACQNAGSGNSSQPHRHRRYRRHPRSTAVSPRHHQPRRPLVPSARPRLRDTATGRTPWLDLNLDLSRFSGNTGCNSMHGKFYFSKTDNSLSFGNKIAIAKMACPGYNEPAFLKSMGNTARYKLHKDTLTLVGDDHSELSRWVRTLHK